MPTCTLHFMPWLPDLRRPFSGTWVGGFVLDVNGQPSHAYGQVEVRPEADGAQILMKPLKPRWVADRPVQSVVRLLLSRDRLVQVSRCRPGRSGSKIRRTDS